MPIETHRNTMRVGDTIVTTTVRTEVESATIDFADILEASQIEPDECMWGETPWDNCDGYEHTAEHPALPRGRGACHDGDGRYVEIKMEFDRDLFEWYRERGATKQVAHEMVALSLRKRLDTLVDWSTNGWEWWHVHCEYKDEIDSCHGIDDHDYAYNDVRLECALNVAHELEQAGYEVHGRPEVDDASTRRFYRRAQLRLNLYLFSWID